jgi:hypothetical protein
MTRVNAIAGVFSQKLDGFQEPTTRVFRFKLFVKQLVVPSAQQSAVRSMGNVNRTENGVNANSGTSECASQS